MKKTCKQCGEVKPLTDFYAHSTMADGHRPECKQCHCINSMAIREARIEYYRAAQRERGRRPCEIASRREYRERVKTDKARKAASDRSKREWEAKNPHKAAARQAVHYAIKTGRLVAQPCEVCGSARAQAHHDDYSKKLDVIWLCPVHHGERHREINAEKRAAECN